MFKKIKKNIFFLFFLLFLLNNYAFSEKSPDTKRLPDKAKKIDFSKNHEIHIQNIEIVGGNIINLEFINKHFEISDFESYWIWELKEKVEFIRKSGYIKPKTYRYYLRKRKAIDTFDLILKIEENPVINKINFKNSTDLDLSFLKEKLSDNFFTKGTILNKKNYNKAVKSFLMYYQKQGYFMVEVDGSLDNPEDSSITIHIKNIDSIYVNFIKVVGSRKLSYRHILKRIKFNFDETIIDNDIFDDSYILIKQMGLFSSVYFSFEKLKDKDKDKDNAYYIRIVLEENEEEEYFTSTQYKSQKGPIFLAHYVNLNIDGERQRITIQAAYQGFLNRPFFNIEYTIPDFDDRYFFALRLSKDDSILSVRTGVNKLREVYSVKTTFGKAFLDFYGIYLAANGLYYKERTIDSNFNTININEPDLKNNIFEAEFGLILSYNSLNDSFNPDRGMRSIFSYTISPFTEVSHIIDGQIDYYFVLSPEIVFAMILQGSYLMSEDQSDTLFAYSNRRTSAPVRDLPIARVSSYVSAETRFSTPFIVDQSYFVLFFETGGIWRAKEDINPEDLGYGAGIGFRWAPNKNYHSFLFGFPGSINIGTKLSPNDYKSPNFTLLQHRDQYYYLNLTAGF